MPNPKPSKWKPNNEKKRAPQTDPKALRGALFLAFGLKGAAASAPEVDALLLWAKGEFWSDHDAKRNGPTRGQLKAALRLLIKKTTQLEQQLASTDRITAELVGAYLASRQTPPPTGLAAVTSSLRELQAGLTASLLSLASKNPGEIAFALRPTFEHLPFRPDKNFDPLAGFFFSVFLGLRGIAPFAARAVPSFAWNSKTKASKRVTPVLKAAPDFLKHFKSLREYAEAAERARREILDQSNFETDASSAQD